MLYVTTRSNRDAFTPNRAMTCDTAPDGGFFVPRQDLQFTEELLQESAARSFNSNIAYVLNELYRTELTGRDIDLAIGKGSAHLLNLDSRTVIAGIWKNAEGGFEGIVDRLFHLMCSDLAAKPGQWFSVSVRIATLFAVFSELAAQHAQFPVDVAVPSYDFQAPMAAWYARSWGLPIGAIVCACNENNAPWSLLHLGELRADPVMDTITPACDQAVPTGLERLICACLGTDEVREFLDAAATGQPYTLELSQQQTLRDGLAVSVISHRRLGFMIPNLYRAGRWYPGLYAAMAYAALSDHRARAGETGKALVMAWDDPRQDAETLAGILNMPVSHFRRKFEK